MGTEKKATEIRKEEIANAALHLISTHGMRGLSMVRIANFVGLVPSALYRHFKNKEGLLNAVYELIEQKMQANISEAWTASRKNLDRLHLLLRLNVRMIIEYPAIPRVAFGEGIYGTDARRRARMYKVVQTYLARLEEMIATAQELSEIRTDLPASTIAVGFWGLIPPAALLWSASDGQFDITNLTEKEWLLFEQMVSVPQELANASPTCRPSEDLREGR